VLTQPLAQEAIALSDSIGTEIDASEQHRYSLFPDIKGFRSARIFQESSDRYRLEYVSEDGSGLHSRTRKISSEALELTRQHIALTEEYHRMESSGELNRDIEPEVIHGLALRYASQADYDMAMKLLRVLISDYPESDQAVSAGALYEDVRQLSESRKAFIWRGSLLDQSGRTDILVFSGYYGLWLGIAAPVFFESDSPQAYAAGFLLGGPLSMWVAHKATQNASISDGRAAMISLGGHLGTWQGLGWASVADMESHEIVGVGALSGLAGIGAAALLTRSRDIDQGYAELTNTGLLWGAWFGLVAAAIAADENGDHDEAYLNAMLIGSDALVLGTAIAAKNVNMSRTRVRLINLAGVLGAVVGGGVDLLFEVDDRQTAFAVAGLGSLVGVGVGAHMTRDFDKKRAMSASPAPALKMSSSVYEGNGWSLSPEFGLKKYCTKKPTLIPTVGFRFTF